MANTRKYWVEVSWLERRTEKFAQHADNEYDAAAKIGYMYGSEDGFRVEQVTYEGD